MMKNITLYISFILLALSLNISAQTTCTDGDRDGDGLCDGIDPCPDVYNTDPVDLDKDEVYDECDNSPLYNPDQADIDGDGIGDVSDDCIDVDRDGICDDVDTCVGIDNNRNGICDNQEVNTCPSQGDKCDDNDPCTTNDRIKSNCLCVGTYVDSDEDGVCDPLDKCEGYDDKDPAIDYDGDGIPNACDNDPVCSACEPDQNGKIVFCNIPLNPYNMYTIKGDCDQLGSYFLENGNFKNDNNQCGPCACEMIGDKDTDGDGVCDAKDECPDNPNLSVETDCGCIEDFIDSDDDGICDELDECPNNPNLSESGECGCEDVIEGCNDPIEDYCYPEYDKTMEWISSMELGGITLDNIDLPSATIHEGAIVLIKEESNQLIINPEHIDDICNISVHVYIDKNNNNNFGDQTELIYQDRGLDQFVAPIDIEDLPAGSYRVRVILHFGRILDPCQAMIQGEIEDFMIHVLDYRPCQEVIESFEYSTGSRLDVNSDGGSGWLEPWSIESSGDNNSVVVSNSLNNHLTNTAGGKLGIVLLNQDEFTFQRMFIKPIELNEELWFEMSYLRTVGDGSINIELGSISFGINDEGLFHLNGITKDQVQQGATYRFRLHVTKSSLTSSIHLQLTVEEDINGALSEIVISTEVNDIDTIFQLGISTSSMHEFTPLLQYFDEIRMSCESPIQIERKENSAISRSINKAATHEIYPNPSTGKFFIDIENPSATDDFRILDMKGQSIITQKISTAHTAVDLSHMKSGIYIAQISNAGKVKNEIIFIE